MHFVFFTPYLNHWRRMVQTTLASEVHLGDYLRHLGKRRQPSGQAMRIANLARLDLGVLLGWAR